MNKNLVSSDVVNKSFLNKNELSDLLQIFYVLMASSSINENSQDYFLPQNESKLKVSNHEK